MRWRRTFVAEVTRTLEQLGMKACPVCGLAESLSMNCFPVLLVDGGFALGEDHQGNLTFAVRMDCTTCGHLMLFDAQRYRTGDEKILVLGPPEDEESPVGELSLTPSGRRTSLWHSAGSSSCREATIRVG